MPETTSKLKIVYLTPALYMAGGVERVLTLKANYFAEHFGYDISIILTEGKDKPLFYPLSEKVRIINLNIGFEELWTCSFLKKIVVYLKKQRQYRKMVEQELMRLRKKIGELHVNRANYRNYNTEKVGLIKRLFARWWSYSLLQKLRKLDRLVVLTEKDREAWTELDNVVALPDPLPFVPSSVSPLSKKRVVAIARYSHEKGIDLLLKAWAIAEKKVEDWQLEIFGDGDKTSFEQLIDTLGIDRTRCWLNGRTDDVEQEYLNSSLFVLSSRFEGFGMVIVEAMACGLPVVAFDCPWGPRSIISDGEDGLLVENGNVEALADALSRLMGDEVLRQSMAEKAIVNVKRFEIETIANQWLHVFNNVMNEKK